MKTTTENTEKILKTLAKLPTKYFFVGTQIGETHFYVRSFYINYFDKKPTPSLGTDILKAGLFFPDQICVLFENLHNIHVFYQDHTDDFSIKRVDLPAK